MKIEKNTPHTPYTPHMPYTFLTFLEKGLKYNLEGNKLYKNI